MTMVTETGGLTSLVTWTGRVYRNKAPVAIIGVPPVAALAWLLVFDAPLCLHTVPASFSASY